MRLPIAKERLICKIREMSVKYTKKDLEC